GPGPRPRGAAAAPLPERRGPRGPAAGGGHAPPRRPPRAVVRRASLAVGAGWPPPRWAAGPGAAWGGAGGARGGGAGGGVGWGGGVPRRAARARLRGARGPWGLRPPWRPRASHGGPRGLGSGVAGGVTGAGAPPRACASPGTPGPGATGCASGGA